MTELAESLFSTPEMAAAFSGQSQVREMLAFEAALARAQARAGIIPESAATAIAAACRVERFDVSALFAEAAVAGTLTIPLVRLLTEQVDEEGRAFVHWGATSQDALDTALMLQARAGIDLLVRGLMELAAACADHAERHRATLMAGRTLLQQALPITFGLKTARWLGLATRRANALLDLRERAMVVQLGGAAGTLASLGDEGERVTRYLAEELGLAVPDLPWHAERDRVAEIAAALGVVAGSMSKIAGDVLLLAQTEVGEVAEAAASGKGGSSAMPQKRNPVDATLGAAAARLAVGQVPVVLAAMSQEHERAAGGWQAEWSAMPAVFRFTAGAVDHVRAAVAGLQVDAARMRMNLDQQGGFPMAESFTMALARLLGRPEAYRLVQEAVRVAGEGGGGFHEAVLRHGQVRAALSEEEIERALDPASYLGSSEPFIQRALAGYQALKARIGSPSGPIHSPDHLHPS